MSRGGGPGCEMHPLATQGRQSQTGDPPAKVATWQSASPGPLLARADVTQAGFARLAGITPRQVNNWARGRAAVPKWAGLLLVALNKLPPESLEIMVEDADFRWHETLGVSPNADTATLRRAMTKLAMRYHPDKGGQPEQMNRVNAAYERAQKERPR